MDDAETEEKLAAVYVTTSPNPISGYVEIVPKKDVVITDWSTEEAMTFVVTSGTNAPKKIRFPKSHDTQQALSENNDQKP